MRKDQRNIVVISRKTAADAQRRVERLLNEPEDLRLVSELECRINVRLERKLPQQPETERVNRRQADISKSTAQIPPACGIGGGKAACFPEPLNNALTHFGGCLPRERDSKDVIGINTGSQQVDIALHDHACLTRAGRRFQHDVAARIDRRTPRILIGQGTVERRLLAVGC